MKITIELDTSEITIGERYALLGLFSGDLVVHDDSETRAPMPEPLPTSAPTVPSAEEYEAVEGPNEPGDGNEDLADAARVEVTTAPSRPRNVTGRTTKIKPVRKPRNGERPERAKPDETPGECIDCAHAQCDADGWFCEPESQALATAAQVCASFFSHRAEEVPPSPPNATVEAPTIEPTASESKTDDEASNDVLGVAIRAKAREMEKIALEHALSGAVQPAAPPSIDDMFDALDDLPTDPKRLRDMVRDEARRLIQGPHRDKVGEVLMQHSPTGKLSDLPDADLATVLQALKVVR